MLVSLEAMAEVLANQMEELIDEEDQSTTTVKGPPREVSSSLTLFDIQVVVNLVQGKLLAKYGKRLAAVSAEALATPVSETSIQVVVELNN